MASKKKESTKKVKSKTLGKTKSSKKKTSKSTSPTMDELLEKYSSRVKSLSFGDKVEGKILEITPKKVIVDIGGKSEGLVAEKAYNEAESYIKTLSVGDHITASVIVPETPEGFIILSLREATQNAIWKKLEKSFKNKQKIRTVGKLITNAGVIVDINGLDGFIPNSQLGKEAQKNTQSMIDNKIEAVVIDLDRGSNKIVLSEKLVSEKDEIELAQKALKTLTKGDIHQGTVNSIYDFGCFVSIEVEIGSGKNKKKVPLEGLVHISELSWDKVNHPKDIVQIGDKIKVKIIAKEDKPVLSMKQAEEDPWDKVEEKYKKDTRVQGKVGRITDFGIFVALESGIEGLVHMTKIPPDKKFSKGDEVTVYIEEVDGKNRKISLGLVLTEKPVGYK